MTNDRSPDVQLGQWQIHHNADPQVRAWPLVEPHPLTICKQCFSPKGLNLMGLLISLFTLPCLADSNAYSSAWNKAFQIPPFQNPETMETMTVKRVAHPLSRSRLGLQLNKQ